MGRSPCCDKANVKKGPWSPEEDAKLKDYIEKNGTGGNWISFPQKAGLKRCGKSCRLRWLNYLRPNIKHGEFSDDEDRLICSLFANIGSRWSIIAAQLPGRTDNDIKNYWNTKLKKKLLGLSLNSSQKSPLINPINYPQFSYSPSLSPSSFNYFTNYDQISTPQNHLNFNNGPPSFSIITKSPMDYNYQVKEGVLMSSCSSSDDGRYIYNGTDDNNQNLMAPNCGEEAIDYSYLEEIKQLSSSNFCNNLNFFVDREIKNEEIFAYNF